MPAAATATTRKLDLVSQEIGKAENPTKKPLPVVPQMEPTYCPENPGKVNLERLIKKCAAHAALNGGCERADFPRDFDL